MAEMSRRSMVKLTAASLAFGGYAGTRSESLSASPMGQDSESSIYTFNGFPFNEQQKEAWEGTKPFGSAYPKELADEGFEMEPLDPYILDLKATDRSRRPELNGRLLIVPAGTVWQVIDGRARGFTSQEIFLKIHSHKWKSGGYQYRVKYTPIQTIEFIEEGPPWTEALGLVRNSAGTVCLFDKDPLVDPKGTLYPVPHPNAMYVYQFDWNKVRRIPDVEFGSYSVGPVLYPPNR